MEKAVSFLQPPTYGNVITILIIDGGGIRRVIPGVILSFLQFELQKLDGEDIRIVDYFDVISGTSSGGLVTAMLTTPNEKNRPMFAAKDIKEFYLDYSLKIFPQRRKLENTRLHQTLTIVVIPTFGIKRLQPTIFASYEVKQNPSFDALLSDICIGTSAAPTYLPAHCFETKDSTGGVRQFNLIDGGVAANNSALVAINEVTKEINRGSLNFFPIKPIEYRRFLVVSLGTGSPKYEEKNDANEAAKWGVLGWLTHGSSTPLVDAFTQSSSDMVDLLISTVFQFLQSKHNYIRIQDDTLSGVISSIDVATTKNLEHLVKIGESLLKIPVLRVNLDTGVYEASNQVTFTNEHALIKYTLLGEAYPRV